MDTIPAAEESAAPAPVTTTGSEATSSSIKQDLHGVGPTDAKDLNQYHDEVDGIKKFDRSNRQPTVEDFDSDQDLWSSRPSNPRLHRAHDRVEEPSNHGQDSLAPSPALSVRSYASTTLGLSMAINAHNTQRSERMRSRNPSLQRMKRVAFSENTSGASSVIEGQSSSRARVNPGRHVESARPPRISTRRTYKQPQLLSRSPSTSDQSSMQGQQSFTDTSRDSDASRTRQTSSVRSPRKSFYGDRSQALSASELSSGEAQSDPAIYSDGLVYDDRSGSDYTSDEESEDSWDLIDAEISEPQPRPSRLYRRTYSASPENAHSRTLGPRPRRRRERSSVRIGSPYDDYQGFPPPSSGPDPWAVVPDAPYPGSNSFYNPIFQYTPNIYPYSNPNMGTYGQLPSPDYGRPMSSAPFVPEPAPAPPGPPPPPLLSTMRSPVLPELRALLAPQKAEPDPVDRPPVPDAPSGESYDSDDDSRTITDEPIDRASHVNKGERAPGGSQDAVLGVYIDETADVDPSHLAQLRFGSNVPLHFTASFNDKWPESSSSGNEIGCAHAYERRDALVARRLRRGDGWQSIELECRQGPSPQGLDHVSQMQWL
jgi:hypothetical protein